MIEITNINDIKNDTEEVKEVDELQKEVDDISEDKVDGEKKEVDSENTNTDKVTDAIDHVIDRIKEEFEQHMDNKTNETTKKRFSLNNIGCMGYLTICAVISGAVKIIQAICSAKRRH